jgi:hypothetical protein
MAKPPSMTAAVTRALKAADPAPQDVGAVALVKLYAHRMDEADRLAEEARLTFEALDPDDRDAHRRLSALARRVEAHAVAKDLGPALLSALGELGLTLRGRRVMTRGGGDEPRAGARSTLDELRARRATRANRAAAVDAASS